MRTMVRIRAVIYALTTIRALINLCVRIRLRKGLFMKLRVLAAALLAFTVAVPPASATVTHLPTAITGRTADRYPEGIAWDPTRRAFLIGSIATRRVSGGGRGGGSGPFGVAPGVSTFGLHVDAARNRVLVTYADIGAGERSSEATA